MIRTLDTFRSKNAHRLTPDQADTLERLSDELRERYDELLKKCRYELSDAELRLQKMRAEQEEVVSLACDYLVKKYLFAIFRPKLTIVTMHQ